MKRTTILLLAALALLSLTACGAGDDNTSETADVALDSFYAGLAEKYEWDDEYMVDIEGEMLENYYPGISDLAAKQMVLKMPMMSAIVNELAFVECETEEDANKAEEIFQARIDYQVGDENNPGGAWYPESIESWKDAQVIRKGNYVAMIASAEHQSEIAESFEQQFQ